VGSRVLRWPVASPTRKYTSPLIISSHEEKRCQRLAGGEVAPAGDRQPGRAEPGHDPSTRADPKPSRRRTVGEGVHADPEYCPAGLVFRISEIQRRKSFEYLQPAYEQQGHGQRVHPVCQPCNEAVAQNNSPQRSRGPPLQINMTRNSPAQHQSRCAPDEPAWSSHASSLGAGHRYAWCPEVCRGYAWH